MSFQPLISSSYMPIPTGSFGPSASLGPFQMNLLNSNMEWIYHYNSTQTLINYNSDSTTYPMFTLSEINSTSGSNKAISSYGPFRINLDKDKQPNLLFIASCPQVYHNNSLGTDIQATGSYIFQLRGYYENGAAFQAQIGTISNITSALASAKSEYWKLLSCSLPPIRFASTSSVLFLNGKTTKLYNLPTRLSKSNSTNNAQQTVCLAFLDVFVSMSNPVGTTSFVYATLDGLYVREICNMEGYSQ